MIYFDNAATTKVSEQAFDVMKKYAMEEFYNPSAGYHEGIVVKEKLNSVRTEMLSLLHGDGSIIFTSGGTESDNTALFCTKKPNDSRIIVSAGEHAAIYYSALALKSKGYDVVFAPINENGTVILDEFAKLMTPNTSFVSIMHVSNETGGVNDIESLVKLAKKVNPKVIFHSDGVQAVGKINVNLRALGVDLYSISGHKLHAPKGTGALYIKKGININPYIIGGGQEGGLRSSTENVTGIIAMGEMVKVAIKNLDNRRNNADIIKNQIKLGLSDKIEGIKFLSPENNASPFILTFTTTKVRGEVMQHALERFGILVGTGSACASNKAGKRIPEALGLVGKYADGILRLSFSEDNTPQETEVFLGKYIKTYEELSKYGS